MNKKSKKEFDIYIKNIDILFKNIEKWLKPSKLKISRSKIEINEEAAGKYKIDKLKINDNNKKNVADVVPIAAWVIGANGRVDLVGKYDRTILVNLEKDKSENSISETNKKESTLYNSINKSGWN